MPDEKPKRSIDDRIDALVMTLELFSRDVQDLKVVVNRITIAIEKDAENIRGLARIAELHQNRLDQHEERMEDLEDRG